MGRLDGRPGKLRHHLESGLKQFPRREEQKHNLKKQQLENTLKESDSPNRSSIPCFEDERAAFSANSCQKQKKTALKRYFSPMISLFVNKSNQTKPNNMLHIGEAIQELMKRQGKTSTWLAQALCCDRTNVYNIYRRSSLDTLLLRRISKVLHHDFFADFSEDLQKEM